MVVRRRRSVMALVAVVAALVGAAYLVRFAGNHALVPFLLGAALVVVAALHATAWWAAREPLLVADLTGLRVRCGGRWAVVPWNDIDRVQVSTRRRVGDGLIVVHARDAGRALGECGLGGRLAVLINRWLYAEPLAVPYGFTTHTSTPDIAATLERLADGRADVEVTQRAKAEPEPEPEPAVSAAPEVAHAGEPSAETSPVRAPRPGRATALRSALSRSVTAPLTPQQTEGSLALSALADPAEVPTERLPELAELRRTANVELVIESTTGLSERAMRRTARAAEPLEFDDAPPVAAEPEPAVEPPPLRGVPAGRALGERIRESRERLEIDVDSLAERTRIRPHVIESIEAGDFSACGGDFYARGHLRMLAGILGLDGAEVVAAYDRDLASAPVSPRAVFDAELSTGVVRPAKRGSRWSVLIAAILLLLLIWGIARAVAPSTPTPSGQPTGHASGPVGVAHPFPR